MYRVDLHTHSVASHDGGLTAEHYRKLLAHQTLHYIAVTDHNRIDFAQDLQRQLGDHILIGEEIMTTAGEIIGLFLKQKIEPHQTPYATIAAIREQGGIVYIPHPFESIRKGLHPAVMDELISHIDIVEVYNGRAFVQDRSTQVAVWSRLNQVPGAASSDAHGIRGIGKTYTIVKAPPTPGTIRHLISEGSAIAGRPGVRALLYPKYNKLKKKLKRG
jgi:predicted metal-dependent phosphoesterase TrpH